MNRLLNSEEAARVWGRRRLFYIAVAMAGMIPADGLLFNDDEFGCVLLFQKTDGTRLMISTDAFRNCQRTQVPGLVDQIVSSLPNPLDVISDGLRMIRNIAIAAALIIGGVLLYQSGALLALRDLLKKKGGK